MQTANDIQHKSWCREHQTDYEGEQCFVSFGWGPLRPATDDFAAHLYGDVWASQGSSMKEPMVSVEYGAQHIEIRVEDLPSLMTAIDGVLEAFASQ